MKFTIALALISILGCGFSGCSFFRNCQANQPWWAILDVALFAFNAILAFATILFLFRKPIARRTVCRRYCEGYMRIVRRKQISAQDIETPFGPCHERVFELLVECPTCGRIHLKRVPVITIRQ
jgi:hypothetical protein